MTKQENRIQQTHIPSSKKQLPLSFVLCKAALHNEAKSGMFLVEVPLIVVSFDIKSFDHPRRQRVDPIHEEDISSWNRPFVVTGGQLTDNCTANKGLRTMEQQ